MARYIIMCVIIKANIVLFCGPVKIIVGQWKLLWASGNYCGPVEIIVGQWKLLWASGNYCGPVDIIVGPVDLVNQLAHQVIVFFLYS